MHPNEPLGRHISPALDEARLARQRAAIEAATRAPARRPRAWSIAAVCAVMALAGFLWLHTRAAPSDEPVAGAVAEASTRGEVITLPDGSRIAFAPQSKATLLAVKPELVRLELERGGADFDVTHVDGRPFIVAAKGYEVQVLGTRFSVRLSPSLLEVKVARGKVRVVRTGDEASTRVLDAGETWSIELERASNEPAPRGTAPQETAPVASAPIAPVLSSEPPAEPAPSAPSPGLAAPGATHSAADGPKELLARAERARAAHRSADEAAALNTLRLRYRSDPRAGLAAFELGRLRLDTLHDPAGAAESFADAISLAPDAPFREDAEARRIEALEAMGDRRRCIEARSAYLSRYPDGLHRPSVSAACSAP